MFDLDVYFQTMLDHFKSLWEKSTQFVSREKFSIKEVKRLSTEIERLKEDNVRLQSENQELRSLLQQIKNLCDG